MSERGLFLVLDGVDGSGKSTQSARLEAALERLGRRPLRLREPGSTAAGEALRELLLHQELGLVPAVETLLFAAARRQSLEERIAPALDAGRDVIVDRFHASTFAYQGVARGGDLEAILALLATWAGTPAPDLELLLVLAPEHAAARRSGPTDRIEALGLAFQRRVAEGYRNYAQRVPRAVVVDALGDEATVFGRLASALSARFPALAGLTG